MVNTCVCASCTNSSLSGHRVHSFPNKKSPTFRSWVRFVQARRQDFTFKSVHPKNSVICSAHFVETDYMPSDLTAFKMGYKTMRSVRLRSDAVPTVHATASMLAAAGAPSRLPSPGKPRAAHRKRETSRILQAVAAASFASPTTHGDDACVGSVNEDVQELSEPVQTHADKSTQCNIKRPYYYRSSGVQVRPDLVSTGTQTDESRVDECEYEHSTPIPSPVSSFHHDEHDLSWHLPSTKSENAYRIFNNS